MKVAKKVDEKILKELRVAKRKQKAEIKRVGRKALLKEADKLYSIRIRQRDGGKCQVRNCTNTGLFTHHIMSRRHYATRWDEDNGFAICWGHHKMGHVDAEWLRDECIAKIGLETFEQIKAKSMTIFKVTEEYLICIVAQLKAAIEKGKEG